MKTALTAILVVFLCIAHSLVASDIAYGVTIQLDSQEEIYSVPAESNDFYVTKITKDNEVRARITSEEAKQQIDDLFGERATYERTIPNRDGYMNYEEMTAALQKYANDYKNLTKLFSIGQSVRGKELWVLEINLTPGRQDNFRPNVKYIGNMHGDEVVGREMLMRLIDLLLSGFGKNPRITALVENTNIFIMPTMNPDGFERGTRENYNRFDLNRNFPDQFRDPNYSPSGRQIEVQHVMNWISSQQFTLSANLHGGDVVANYPWDGSPNPFPPRNNPTTDDDIFREMSYEYARHNPAMIGNTRFKDGITNGAAWYALFGGMQDWNYLIRGCMEITLELSHTKWPPGSQLDTFWGQNNVSLVNYLEQVYKGFKGQVKDAQTNAPIANANVTVGGRDLVVQTRENGAYFRVISNGSFKVTVSAPGYETLEDRVVVTGNKAVVRNFNLVKIQNDTEARSISTKGEITLTIIFVTPAVIGVTIAAVLFIIYMVKFR